MTMRARRPIIGALATAVLLSGCAFGSGGAEDAGGDAPTEGEPVTLTFQSLEFQDTAVQAVQDIVDTWNQENPDIQVELTQGSWDNVHDQLVTQFQGSTAPDIIQYESAGIGGFAEQGYLADLSPHLSDDLKSSISDDIWGTVTSADGAVVAAPTVLQSYVVFANLDAIEAAGAQLPSGDELAWDDFQQLARDLTAEGRFGLGWGLRQPTATVMNLSVGFGGTYFDNGSIEVADAELEVPRRIHQMAFDDKSLDPVTLTQSGSDVLPGFFAGDYALYVGGNFIAQQITEGAPDGFRWAVLPPLAGSESSRQAANPQTLSVAAESEHVEEAAQFIEYYMQAENLARVAEGNWLIPSTDAAREQLASDTKDQTGWAEILATGDSLSAAPFQTETKYTQWKDQIATPALQQYFAGSIDDAELARQLEEGFASLG
jgi:multiple sugar transport system substrate-binding protein